MYIKFLKRILDIIGALLLFIILSPMIILLCVILLFYNKGNVFFTQMRPGKNGKPFILYKFRTMDPSSTDDVSETESITPLGNVLRKTSFDEIPQLLNVLKGEMSLIGPRPLLMEYLPLYSDVQQKRHSVLPGITGWAQINGRNSISWEDKFRLDVYYAEHITFWLDLKILFITFFKVLPGKGVYNEEGKIIEKFKGNQS